MLLQARAIVPLCSPAEGGASSRSLEYISPLKNPLGPKQARNVEVLEVAQLAPSGFVLRTKCTTEGVSRSPAWHGRVSEWFVKFGWRSASAARGAGAMERACGHLTGEREAGRA